ncbi:MAG: cyclic nucleotide-binding domain-containing protein [Planctomycetes bacterium]|nr:cyclic nucleotide-binding domain-containing protein [Planctomycetota bacterium]
MDTKDIFEFIRNEPFFTSYSDGELADLMKVIVSETVNAGELIFDQGDPGDRFYIVYSGKIRIFRKNDIQKEINLGVNTRGDHFGETALITDSPRNASARAVEESVLLSIEKKSFNEYIFSKPDLREYFDKFVKFTSINQFLKSSTDLSALSPKDLKELIRSFNSELYKEGDVIFRQDLGADKFYIIESGKLKVVRWEENKQVIINLLREGDFFGEKSIIEETLHHADVVCLTDCHLFSLTKETFRELVVRLPRLKSVIEGRIKSYVTDKPPVPYEEMIEQELAASKKVEDKKDVSKEETTHSGKRKKYFRKLSSYYYRHVSFPFIKQYDQTTCGITCIMMIARFYGKSFSSAKLRELAHVDTSGSSMANLASASEQLGFSTRGMRLDYGTLASVHLPCIVHWQGYHYVVVYKIDKKGVWVSDPALGLRKYKREFFEKNWNGITLILEPTVEFEKQEEDTSSFKHFIQFVLPYKLILFEIFIASLLLNLFGLATPIFTQNVVDKVLTHHNVSMLNMMLAGMLLVLVFRVLTMIVRQYLIIHTSLKIDLTMLVLFYKHILALPLGYFKVRKIGDFITRFGENMKIRNFLTNTALTIVLDAVLIVVYISLMFYYNRQMTIIVLLFIPVFVAMTLVFTPILKRLNVDSFKARTESQSHLIESINAIDTVKAMNMEYSTRWKWENKFIKALNIDFKLYNTTMYFNSIGDFVGTLSSTIILWYGAHKVMEGMISIGELMAFMALMGSVITPINRIIMAWDDIQQTIVSIDRLNDVFTAKPELHETMDEEAGIIIKEPKGEVVFDSVYFRYGGEDDSYILSNLNIAISPGQKVAVIGRSGSGKTTFARLISRLYDTTEGKIMIDGCDVKNINLSNLRQLVGFVLQENFIFNGTIRENISLGDPLETMEKIIEAANMANAHDFITNTGSGYETKVGESGLQLSGGQKQRIAIARVLYSRPKIIIFDEATSSLDTESELAIQKNMNTILKDKTSIIIAHRLSTVKNADNIIVLDKGEIVEQGAHEELITKRGLYHYLSSQQLNL